MHIDAVKQQPHTPFARQLSRQELHKYGFTRIMRPKQAAYLTAVCAEIEMIQHSEL